MVSSPLLSAAYGDPHPDPKYQVAGALQHICNTRPDIHYCVNKVNSWLLLVSWRQSLGWSSKKQGIVAHSSAKAEFQSLANAISGRSSKPIRLRQKLGVSSPLKVAGFSTHLGDEEEREE
ncbi:Retrovirus-related Pol polyprotein from transposon TNT 1-94 [Gossypium australe]|uniref:Retrovirus-related Pol polyprotein from transposon TNT 1-94 n=1 Tax=Gossypium australe TaxID=47621 RepID=A0A5B6VTI8_9ROSI|nr:Retrovirus-related Pol polyprotein from transposon TNT 1-94 [Gossypium australe]